jgi:chromosome segregation ATPase
LQTATSDAGALALSSALIPDAALASDELRQLRERIATLENGTELAELRARNSDLERLAGELRSLNGELRRANSRLRESGAADTAPDAGEASRLHARVAELEHALALANSEIGALQAARHAAAGTPADVAALEQSLRDAKHALAQARADARAAQQNADEARSALQAATEALDAADEEQSALRREADDAHERLAQQQERAARTRVAEAAAAAGRTLAVQHERSQKAVAEAVERLRRLLAAKAAANAARSRTTAATATKPTPAVADVSSSPSSAGGTKRAATEPSDPPQSKRTTVDSGTQTVGWSREHEFECLRFSHDLLAQRMAEMRGQFTQKLQHMHKLQDAVEQRRQTEAQEWSDMLSTTVESLKAQMTNGLKESVLRVRQLQSELECEQQLNERLAAELEQLRAAEPGSAPDSLSAASPVARALERLREQLQTSRSRVDELESENELLMEKLVECETVPAPEPEQTQPAASPPPEREVAPLADADEERVAAQRDAMECFPSMENVTMTRRRGRK